ncbi:hypothetical protein MW887_011418 [Aspergillus wentii]|nr:hypothetical protein MW887_011418 [Aspergillus wentii]
MLEVRLGFDPSQTQTLTTAILSIHGFLGIVSAPVIAHFADKTPNRKVPLLIALAGCLVGTVLVASTLNLAMLFVGRVFQSIAGSAAWIVGFAMMADAVPTEHMGKMMGVALSFVTAGIISGPMVAGAMLELLGYWPAWTVPLVVLAMDFLARVVMIETPKEAEASDVPGPADEETSLLHSQDGNSTPEIGKTGFYRLMLSKPRVLIGLLNVFLYSSIMAGFNATIPLHVRYAFNWGSLPAGMMFLCLQLPCFVLSVPAGWMRDKYGQRYPITLGWCILTPILWLLGVPGDEKFPWASAETNGKTIFVCALVAYGTFGMLVRSGGGLQVTRVGKEMQTKNPQIFGPHGGHSRVFSMVEVAFSTGTMAGPLIAGPLSENVGFYYMTITFACLAAVLAVLSLSYMDGPPKKQQT